MKGTGAVNQFVLEKAGPETLTGSQKTTRIEIRAANEDSPGERKARARFRFETDSLNLEQLERRAIIVALEKSDWVQIRAAKLLGVSPRGLVYKIKKHSITDSRLRSRRRRT